MTVLRLSVIGAALFLSACQTDPGRKEVPAVSENEWQASSLSEQTIARAQNAVKEYERCLNAEALQRVQERGDPRALADRVLQACEDRLGGIKTAFDAEQVPASISERYMRQTRSRGAQSLMRFVQAVQAQRAAAEAETAASGSSAR